MRPWVTAVSFLPSAGLGLVQWEEHQGLRNLGAESQVCLLICCTLSPRLTALLPSGLCKCHFLRSFHPTPPYVN